MKYRSITRATILLALAPFSLCLVSRAVVPAPDGGYPGFNTAEGQNALFSRTTGVWNTALGAFTLYSDTTGNGNTAVGINVLRDNVTGGFNTAVGLNALYFNNGNPANLEAYQNSGCGSYALFHNTTGSFNCAFGANALSNNTVGKYNTATGCYALSDAFSEAYNTATGYSAMGHAGGNSNTADGAYALNANFSGSENIATGMRALYNNYTGGANTAVGFGALGANTTGGANTAIGHGAGANVTTGSYNVYIGHNVAGVADEVGHTYISNISSTQQNLSLVTVNLQTGLLGHEFSSKRYKEDIKPMDKASEALFGLKPVTYRYKKEIDKSQALDYGLVAEEVAKVDSNLAVRDGKGQIESVRYNAINAMLLNEFLKEHKKVEQLELAVTQQRNDFEATIAELKKELDSVATRSKDQDEKIQKVKARVELNKTAPRTIVKK